VYKHVEVDTKSDFCYTLVLFREHMPQKRYWTTKEIMGLCLCHQPPLQLPWSLLTMKTEWEAKIGPDTMGSYLPSETYLLFMVGDLTQCLWQSRQAPLSYIPSTRHLWISSLLVTETNSKHSKWHYLWEINGLFGGKIICLGPFYFERTSYSYYKENNYLFWYRFSFPVHKAMTSITIWKLTKVIDPQAWHFTYTLSHQETDVRKQCWHYLWLWASLCYQKSSGLMKY
jgi:hypothetical protein